MNTYHSEEQINQKFREYVTSQQSQSNLLPVAPKFSED